MTESAATECKKGFFSKEYHRSTGRFERRERNGSYNWNNNKFNWKKSEIQGRSWRSNDDYESNQRKTIITVPAKKVGKIIGRKGVKIKEIQSSCNTSISIGKEEDIDGNVKVTVIGESNDIEKCKEMIEELTQDLSVTNIDAIVEKEEKRNSPIDWDAINLIADEYEKVRWADCPPLKKNFYMEDPAVTDMSEETVKQLRKKYNNITVKHTHESSDKIPNPIETFEQAFGHYPEILEEIEKQQFPTPFPIQAQAWPILLSGMDMIGIAQTGTGKTLSFLLPALIHTDGQEVARSERGGPNVLILAPTRELALQIDKEVQKYSYRDIKSVCIYGGGSRRDQIDEVTRGVEIIIATPGRLNDLVQAGHLKLRSITFLVLDEADRMLDMGFEPQIRKILLHIRPDRQTVMTSATWPFIVQLLAEKHMLNPIQVVVGSLDLAAVHSVKQTVVILNDEEKFGRLLDTVKSMSEEDKLIVFVDKKSMADALSCDLILSRIDCQSIHGDREQCDREQAIEDLKTGSVKILIATDVASRGIDVIDITKVLNYDFPRHVEEYVHRVGRTGRAGRTGEAITFFTRRDWSHAKELISILEEAEQEVPDELYGMRDRFQAAREKRKSEKGRLSGGGRRFGNNFGIYSVSHKKWW